MLQINEFIEDFKKSEFYDYMLSESPEEIMGIYIGGSILNGASDDQSDIDLMIIIDGSAAGIRVWRENTQYLVYKDYLRMHWNWRTIDRYYTDEVHNLELCGHYMMRNLSYNNFIYINEKYKSELDKLLSDKYIISENGCRALTKALSTLICSVCEDNKILEKNYNKMLYHLSLCYYYLNNIEPDFNYIKEIKRIQYRTVRQEYLDRCIEIMHWLKENILEK